FIAKMPPWTPHVVVATALPADAEGAICVHAQGRSATVLPMRKEKITDMASGMILGNYRGLGKFLGVRLIFFYRTRAYLSRYRCLGVSFNCCCGFLVRCTARQRKHGQQNWRFNTEITFQTAL